MKKKNILFICLIFCLSLFLITFVTCESDYLWHIKAGEYMFNNHILKHDVFSWSMLGKSWISHEWLFEYILYGLSIIFPKTHLIVYGFISTFTLLLILFLTNKKDYLKNIPFTLIWITFAMILTSYMQGRPNLLSFIFLTLTVYLLYDNYQNDDSKLIYFIPLITILWSNIHGGSANLSYILCFIFYICSFFSFNYPKIISNKTTKIKRRRYLITFFLCLLSININIHGFTMLIYPYKNMMDNTMLTLIQEWRPLNLNVLNNYPYILLVLLIFSVLILSKKKINFIDLVLFLFSVFLGFKSIRFCVYTYIIMSYIVFKYINQRKEDKGTNLVIIILSISFLSLFIINFNNISTNINKKELSKDTIKLLIKEKPSKLYNDYNLGGELIYNNIPVFIDGRADLYSPNILKDYIIINNTSMNYKDLLNKYEFDYYIIDKYSNINEYLKENNSYTLIKEDSNYLLYKKN